MSLDAIRKTIISEAESKASAMESEAKKEAQRIIKEAEDKAKAILKNAEADARREAERLNKEAQAGAEMEANSMLLEARGEAVERSLKKVLADAQVELSRTGMKRILEQSIKQFKEVSAGDFVIKTSKKNSELFRKSAYDVEYADIDGFMLYSDHGKVALNATVQNIVQREADNARKLISAELFGAHSSTPRTVKQAKAPAKKAKPMKKSKAKGKKTR